jgi:hypothetical protein
MLKANHGDKTDFISLVTICIIAFVTKVYCQSKLDNPERKGNSMLLFNRYFSIRYLFPISQKNYNQSDYQTITTANRALLIFWITFIATILVGLIDAI